MIYYYIREFMTSLVTVSDIGPMLTTYFSILYRTIQINLINHTITYI